MTPQQASLVLFHQVPPASFDDQINALEAEFQRQQDKESEEHQRQLAEAEKAAAFASAQRIQQQEEEEPEHQQQQNQERKQVENETKLASTILESLDDRKPELHEINNSCGGDTKSADTDVDHDRNRRSVRSESNMKSSAKTSTVFGQTCYEVVEVKDGTESRVGLYLDRDEAQLGMDTRQMIHDRRVDKRDSDENGSCEGESVYIVRQVSNDH
jgi:ATP-dependent 26S proteasome regulatory subunit